jgi:hypothetical protein
MVARPVSRASAVIGHQDTVQTVVYCEPCVLARVDPLDDEPALPERPQAIDEGPVHRRVLRGHTGHVDAVIHPAIFDARTGLPGMAASAWPQIFGPRPQVGFAIAPGRIVDRQRDHRAAGGFDAAKQLLAGCPRARGVELIPHGTAERGVHVLDAGRRGGRENLECPVRFGRARDGQFPVWMRHFVEGRRRDQDGMEALRPNKEQDKSRRLTSTSTR